MPGAAGNPKGGPREPTSTEEGTYITFWYLRMTDLVQFSHRVCFFGDRGGDEH